MDPLKVSEFIKQVRKDNKLTQKKLAEKYNVTSQIVSKWENGKDLPDVSILEQISKDYNVSIDELLDVKVGHSKIAIIFKILLFIIVAGIIVFIVKNTIAMNAEFKFKTLTNTCDKFEISGRILYNKKKAVVYLSNVEYCGGDDETKYSNITSVLYERQSGKLVELENTKKSSKNLKLEDHLKKLEMKIEDYETKCKDYTNTSLVLEVNATDKNKNIVTYKIPLDLKEKCKN